MRIGVSSRGNAWVSMGPLGWLILGPLIAAGYLMLLVLQVLFWLCSAAAQAIGAAIERRARR